MDETGLLKAVHRLVLHDVVHPQLPGVVGPWHVGVDQHSQHLGWCGGGLWRYKVGRAMSDLWL